MLHLSLRDRDLLQLLDRTPATAPLVLKASSTFAGGPFRDERRARERLQQLIQAGIVRKFRLAQIGGGAMNYYKLTAAGFATLHGDAAPSPSRAYFAELPLSRLEHTLALAEIIVHTLVAAHLYRIQVTKFHRENELTLAAGSHAQQPDFHVQLFSGGRLFNVLIELDRSTESLNSTSDQSVRQKILAYEAYQDMIWEQWRQAGRHGPRPYFKVAFLTISVERAYHILVLARDLARNPKRRLCYAATQESYLATPDALREPLFLDHDGAWQTLANVHPSSRFLRAPVRLPKRVEPVSTLW